MDDKKELEPEIDLELPQIIKLMKDSIILNIIYRYYLKIVSGKAGEIDFFKNKTNIKYITFGICILLASSFIGFVSYFLFYIMFFFSSLKCVLWMLEHYVPEKTIKNIDNKTYVSDESPINVIELYFIPIFIFLIMHPVAYIPIPFLSFIVYSSSVILGLATMTNKTYRQKFCVFIRDLFISTGSRDSEGKYIPGNEGELHKLLQTICCSIESIFINTFHIADNLKNTLNKTELDE